MMRTNSFECRKTGNGKADMKSIFLGKNKLENLQIHASSVDLIIVVDLYASLQVFSSWLRRFKGMGGMAIDMSKQNKRHGKKIEDQRGKMWWYSNSKNLKS